MEFNRGNKEMERHKKIVVDASVVIKWFVEEDHTERSIKILEDYFEGTIVVYSTQLMPYEVINALRYNPEMGKDDLTNVSDTLKKLKLNLYPIIDDLYTSTISLAMDFGTTIYDASYLALSNSLEAVLYTADQKFLNKVLKNGNLSHVSRYS